MTLRLRSLKRCSWPTQLVNKLSDVILSQNLFAYEGLSGIAGQVIEFPTFDLQTALYTIIIVWISNVPIRSTCSHLVPIQPVQRVKSFVPCCPGAGEYSLLHGSDEVFCQPVCKISKYVGFVMFDSCFSKSLLISYAVIS